VKRFALFLPILALAASLGACVFPDASAVVPGATATPLPAPVAYQNKTIATVEQAIVTAQAATLKACKYRPAASFLLKVAATFSSFDEALAYVDTLAERTCVAAGATLRADAGPATSYASLSTRYDVERRTHRVRGILVEGQFVRVSALDALYR
jgi:hypothetical protein